MATVRIKIGAQIDPSIARCFEPLLAASGRARAKLAADGAAAGKAWRQGFEGGASGKAFEATARAAAAADAKIVASGRAAARERERAYDDEARAAQRAFKERERAVKSTISSASRTFGGVVQRGVGAAGSIARASGVELDPSAFVRRAVDAERKATDILNQVRLAGGAAPEGGARGLASFANVVGQRKGIATGDVLGALGEFQAKSNDLATGQATIAGLADIAKAAGAEFKDVGSAAAFINAQLADGPDKADKLLAIMRAITAQTAAGQIELSDWAKFMPRIAAAANAFSGDYSKNIGTLSALAQISVKGGRATAAEASGSAAALPRDLQKARTLKAFAAAGIDVFADKGHTQMKQVDTLIFEAIEKTKGDRAKLAKLFPNVVSAAPVMALANIYNKAGGGAKGMAAARGELAQYDKSLSAGDVGKLAAESMGTTATKAEQMNAALERIAMETLPKLIPPLEQLAPLVVKGAEAFASLATFAAQNPGEALLAAIVASVARAAIGQAVSSSLASSIAGAGPLIGGPAGVALGAIMAGLAVKYGIDKVTEARSGAVTNATNQDVAVMNALSLAKHAKTPEEIAAASKAVEAAQGAVQNRVEAAQGMSFLGMLNPLGAQSLEGRRQAWNDQGNMGGLTDQARELADAHKSLAEAGKTHADAAGAMKEAAGALKEAAGKLGGSLPGHAKGATTGT